MPAGTTPRSLDEPGEVRDGHAAQALCVHRFVLS